MQMIKVCGKLHQTVSSDYDKTIHDIGKGNVLILYHSGNWVFKKSCLIVYKRQPNGQLMNNLSKIILACTDQQFMETNHVMIPLSLELKANSRTWD